MNAMIPGGDGYPSAVAARVPHYVEDRLAEGDRDQLERIVAITCDAVSATDALRLLEAQHASDFGWLRELTYHGYYAAPAVLAAMSDRGYAYHGAPQPLGYVIAERPRVPVERRGSYIPTSEVRRAEA